MYLVFCLPFSQIICSSIRFRWLGQCEGERRRELRRERGRQTHGDRAIQRQSICMHAGRKKKCWVGRLRVQIHDREQKQEGCRAGQVGAAWQMEHYDYSVLGRETSV